MSGTFSLDEVRSVLRDADRPLSTREVAQACRRAVGRPERVAEPREVRYRLGQLAQAGEIVHAAGDGPADWTAMLPNEHRGQRYWATRPVAEAAVAAARERRRAWDEIDDAHVDLKRAWAAAGGPGHTNASPNPLVLVPNIDDRVGRPELAMRLNTQQVRWLTEKLGDLHQ